MTPSTREPYLKLPEDINRAQPGYFHDVFHLVHAYLELIRHVPDQTGSIGKGLVKLYGYRMGVLSYDNDLLLDTYMKLVGRDRSQQKLMGSYAQSLIEYNIVTLYRMLSNTLTADLQRGFGDDRCLTTEVMEALNHFAKAQDVQYALLNRPGTRSEIHDNMSEVVQTCRYNAMFIPPAGVTSAEAMIRALDALDKVIDSVERFPEQIRRRRLTHALQIAFYLGVRYYKLNLRRFSDEIIDRSYDRCLDITDLTLAAVPFDPSLLYTCADETIGISRWGIEYVQSLEAVLLYMGGVRFQAVLAVEANGNKGVPNV